MNEISQTAQHWYKHRTARQKSEDIIKAAVDLGTNFVVTDLIIQKLGIALGYMANNCKKLRSLEYAADLLDEDVSFQTALEAETYSLQEAEKAIQSHVQQQITQLFEWEIEESRNAAGKLEKIRAKQPRNNHISDPQLIKAATKQAENHFVIPEAHIAAVKEFAQKYRFIEVELDGAMQVIEVNWEHILLPTIKTANKFNHARQAREVRNFEIKGWYQGLWKEFEQQGLINIVNKGEKNDCTYLEFNWTYNNKNKPAEKSFFPESWSHEKIKDNIIEAISNISSKSENKKN